MDDFSSSLSPSTNYVGGSAVPRAGLVVVVSRKVSASAGNQTSVIQHVV